MDKFAEDLNNAVTALGGTIGGNLMKKNKDVSEAVSNIMPIASKLLNPPNQEISQYWFDYYQTVFIVSLVCIGISLIMCIFMPFGGLKYMLLNTNIYMIIQTLTKMNNAPRSIYRNFLQMPSVVDYNIWIQEVTLTFFFHFNLFLLPMMFLCFFFKGGSKRLLFFRYFIWIPIIASVNLIPIIFFIVYINQVRGVGINEVKTLKVIGTAVAYQISERASENVYLDYYQAFIFMAYNSTLIICICVFIIITVLVFRNGCHNYYEKTEDFTRIKNRLANYYKLSGLMVFNIIMSTAHFPFNVTTSGETLTPFIIRYASHLFGDNLGSFAVSSKQIKEKEENFTILIPIILCAASFVCLKSFRDVLFAFSCFKFQKKPKVHPKAIMVTGK